MSLCLRAVSATCGVQEFTLNTQLDLERQAAASQSRALVAEEQLQSLQHYISQSTVTYQKEIMRLRSLLSSQQQQQQQQQAQYQHPQQQQQHQHQDGQWSGDVETSNRQAVQRSGSAGDVLNRPPSGSVRKPALLRPIRSATNGQGQLSRPLNERPAVDAWHAP